MSPFAPSERLKGDIHAWGSKGVVKFVCYYYWYMSNAGRPSKYKKEYIAEVDKYLANCVDSYSDDGRNRLTVQLPTIEGFSLYLGVALSSIYLWAKEHSDFSESLELIKFEQKQRLLSKGLSNEYNSTIAKLILSSNHGMAEKTEAKNEVTHHLDEESKNLIDKALDDV